MKNRIILVLLVVLAGINAFAQAGGPQQVVSSTGTQSSEAITI